MDGATATAGTLYDADVAGWAEGQAVALRARDSGAVDWENLAEEIEALGRSERRSLQSALALMLEHKIRLDHGRLRAPERGSRETVIRQRIEVERILEDNPSLARQVPELIRREYPRARRKAMAGFETHEPEALATYERVVPPECPCSPEEVL